MSWDLKSSGILVFTIIDCWKSLHLRLLVSVSEWNTGNLNEIISRAANWLLVTHNMSHPLALDPQLWLKTAYFCPYCCGHRLTPGAYFKLIFFILQLTTLDAQALEKTPDFPGLEHRGQGYPSATGLNRLIAKEAKETAVADCQDIKVLAVPPGWKVNYPVQEDFQAHSLDRAGQRMALINHTHQWSAIKAQCRATSRPILLLTRWNCNFCTALFVKKFYFRRWEKCARQTRTPSFRFSVKTRFHSSTSLRSITCLLSSSSFPLCITAPIRLRALNGSGAKVNSSPNPISWFIMQWLLQSGMIGLQQRFHQWSHRRLLTQAKQPSERAEKMCCILIWRPRHKNLRYRWRSDLKCLFSRDGKFRCRWLQPFLAKMFPIDTGMYV